MNLEEFVKVFQAFWFRYSVAPYEVFQILIAFQCVFAIMAARRSHGLIRVGVIILAVHAAINALGYSSDFIFSPERFVRQTGTALVFLGVIFLHRRKRETDQGSEVIWKRGKTRAA